jgi:tRNA threonylcarbamoyladenosine biosynthesis protein TsaB
MHKTARILALETSTQRLSVGLSGHAHGQASAPTQLHEGEGGAQASATLIPVALQLLEQAGLALNDLDALAFGRGPGSFTGLRTACAVAQGLAYGVRSARHPDGLPVLAIDTLLAVAEDARHQLAATGATPGQPLVITALLDARMDEIYAATYTFSDPVRPQATLDGGPWLLSPDRLAGVLPPQAATGVLAGNALDVYGPRLPHTGSRLEAWPTAAALLRLAPHMLARGSAVAPADAQPLYVRDKVAQTTAERAALAASPA